MPPEAKAGPYGYQPLKDLLTEKGITRAAAAKAVGYSVNQITMTVNGQTTPSLPLAGRLAALVGATIEECFSPAMLGREKPRPPRKGQRAASSARRAAPGLTGR